MTLSELQKKHDRNFGKEPGGHVEYVMACKHAVPPLIRIAHCARALMVTHQDTERGVQLRQQMHEAIRELERV